MNTWLVSPEPVLFISVTRLMRVWGMTPTHEWVMTHIWVMAHILMSHVSRMNESCPTYEWVTSRMWTSHVTDMNAYVYEKRPTYVKRDLYTYEKWPTNTCERVMSQIWMRHVTHVDETCHTYERVMSHMWISHVGLFPYVYTHKKTYI